MKLVEPGFGGFMDCWYVKVIVNGLIGHIPRGIEDGAEDFRLEALDALGVS